MATTQYNLDRLWQASARYTAAGDIDVLITNPTQFPAFWWITTNDTAPTINYETANPIGALGSQAISLATGERVWLAGPDMATANVQE